MINDFPLDRALPPAWLTVPLSKLYEVGASWYHRRYDSIEPYRAPVPVISVGNITAGGTGKTPTVIALTQLLWKLDASLKEQNRVAVLSRGYGRESRKLTVVSADSQWEDAGDEPLLIKKSVPEVAVVVHADRVRAARHAAEKLGARCLILDDGFQHRRLARNLNIVLVDGEHPLGNGRLLPAGPLREPPKNLRRASLLLGVGKTSIHAESLAQRLNLPFAAETPLVRLPRALSDGSIRRVIALASIARPERFVNDLINNKLDIISQEIFADHHRYTTSDVKSVSKKAHALGAEAVVTTQKDQMRLPPWTSTIPLLVTQLEMTFENPTFLGEILMRALART